MLPIVSGHCPNVPAARTREQRRFQLGLRESPRPFVYKTQVSSNLVCPEPLLYYLLSISLVPPRNLHHINHTTTMFLSLSVTISYPFVTSSRVPRSGWHERKNSRCRPFTLLSLLDHARVCMAKRKTPLRCSRSYLKQGLLQRTNDISAFVQ
jgi:hypothetical protein